MVSGIILAGGASLGMRMKNKALYPYGDERLLGRQIRIMSELCKEVIVVSDTPKSYLSAVAPPVRLIANYRSGSEMLGGLAAGLSLSQYRYAWVVGSDMPKLSSAAARLMLRQFDGKLEAVWPADKQGAHPLHGVYDCECAGKVASLVDEGMATLADLPNHLAWRGIPDNEFVRLGIGYDFVETIDGKHAHEGPIDRESSYRTGNK